MPNVMTPQQLGVEPVPPLLPQDPSSSIKRKPGTITPAEYDRLRRVMGVIDDPKYPICSIHYPNELRATAAGQMGLLDQALTAQTGSGLEPYVPQVIDKADAAPRYRFGLDLSSLEQLESVLIGSIPCDLIRLAAYYSFLTPPEEEQQDLFPTTILSENFSQRMEEVLPDTVKVRTLEGEEPPEGKRLVEREDLQAVFMRKYAKDLSDYFVSIKVAMRGMPLPTPMADLKQALDPTPEAVPGARHGESPEQVVARYRQSGWRVIPDIRFETLPEHYRTYMKDEFAPLLDYIRKVGRRIAAASNPAAGHPFATDKIETALCDASVSSGTAITVNGKIVAGPRVSLKYNWHIDDEEAEKAARGLFPAGRTEPGVIIIDLGNNLKNSFFARPETGEMTPRAMELIEKVSSVSDENVGPEKPFRIIFCSPKPPRVPAAVPAAQTRQASKHPAISELALPTPMRWEVENVVMVNWIASLMKQGHAFTQDGNPVTLLTDPSTLKKTQDGVLFFSKASKFCMGMSATGMRKFLDDIKRDAIRKAIPESAKKLRLKQEEHPPLDVAYMLQRMPVISGELKDKDPQVYGLFKVVIEPGKKLALPPNVEELVKNYKVANKVGATIESRSKLTKAEVEEAARTLGIDLFELTSYLQERVPGVPAAQKVWSELTDADMPEVQEQIKAYLLTKKLNFILFFGPAGTGKTSMAQSIANLLDFGFQICDAKRAKAMWVGETERIAEAMFDALETLQNHVVLLDEVDVLFESSGGEGSVGLDPGAASLHGSFKQRMFALEPIAKKNNLIIISTTNYIDELKNDEALLRRLDSGGKASIEVGPLTDPKLIGNLLDILFENNVSKLPSAATITAAKPAFLAALVDQAQRDTPFSHYEIESLLQAWTTWNMGLASRHGQSFMDPETKQKTLLLYQPQTLVWMVTHTPHATQDAAFSVKTPPDSLALKQPEAPKPAPAKGLPFRDVTRLPRPGTPGQPPSAPPPVARPGEAPEQVPPLAADVDVEQQRELAEEQSVQPAARKGRPVTPRASSSKQSKEAAVEKKDNPIIKLMAIAENEIEQSHGLKFVTHLPVGEGMLFKFQSPRVLSFWMEQTYIPLDIAFIDHNNLVVKTDRMVPLSLRSVSSGRPCVMALEVAAGMLEKFGGKIGSKAIIDMEKKTVRFDA